MSTISQLLGNLAARFPGDTPIINVAKGVYGLKNLEDEVFNEIGLVVNGILNNTQSLPEIKSKNISIPDAKVVEFTPAVPGYENILRSATSKKQDITKMTSSSLVGDGENNFILTLGKPFAMANALSQVTNTKVPFNIISPFIPIETNAQASETFITSNYNAAMPGATNALTQSRLAILNSILGSVNNNYKNLTESAGFLATYSSSKNNEIENAISFLNLNDEVKSKIIPLVINGDKNTAINKIIEALPLNERSDAKIKEIEEAVAGIDTSITANTTNGNSIPNPAISTAPITTSQKFAGYQTSTKSANMPYRFPIVAGKEELIADFNFAKENREITALVNHWTGHFKNDSVITAQHIHDMHMDPPYNYSGIGYHYIILSDGRIQRGRPVNIVGNHVKDMDQRTIGVAGVGGIGLTREYWQSELGEKFSTQGYPYGGRWYSDAQAKTFKLIAECFYSVWDAGEIYGHMDMKPSTQQDPDWPEEWLPSMFKRKNKFDPTKGAPTTAQILGDIS